MVFLGQCRGAVFYERTIIFLYKTSNCQNQEWENFRRSKLYMAIKYQTYSIDLMVAK